MVEGLLLAVFLVVAIVAIFSIPFKILEWMNEIVTEYSSPMISRVLMFIPWLFMLILCFFLEIILAIWGALNAIFLANAARDWWHNGKK